MIHGLQWARDCLACVADQPIGRVYFRLSAGELEEIEAFREANRCAAGLS